jgi:hypothetical protein
MVTLISVYVAIMGGLFDPAILAASEPRCALSPELVLAADTAKRYSPYQEKGILQTGCPLCFLCELQNTPFPQGQLGILGLSG